MVFSLLGYFATWQSKFRTRMFLGVENEFTLVWDVQASPSMYSDAGSNYVSMSHEPNTSQSPGGASGSPLVV